MTFWPMPPSPESMIFSISAMTGSGEELRTGKMPTDCPRIQSASKDRMVSTAVARSDAAAADDQRVAGIVGAHGRGFDAESIEQLEDVLRRDIAQRHDGDALAGLRACRAVDAAGAGFRRRQQAIAGAVAHQRHAGHAQRILQHVDRVRLGYRPHRGERHGALHAGIDRVANVEYVTKDDLCDGRDRRILEIEVIAAAAAIVALGQRAALRRRTIAEIDRGFGRFRLTDAACPCIRRLPRLEVEGADLVGEDPGRADPWGPLRPTGRL